MNRPIQTRDVSASLTCVCGWTAAADAHSATTIAEAHAATCGVEMEPVEVCAWCTFELGRPGDRDGFCTRCLSVVDQLRDGTIELVPLEYGASASAPVFATRALVDLLEYWSETRHGMTPAEHLAFAFRDLSVWDDELPRRFAPHGEPWTWLVKLDGAYIFDVGPMDRPQRPRFPRAPRMRPVRRSAA